MSRPLAVCISDIHFSVPNLSIASAALRAAKKRANELDVSLIIAGDLHDTKAIIRGEVANELIRILSREDRDSTYILVGNHDLINQKAAEHSLNFLRPYAGIVDKPGTSIVNGEQVAFIPYQADNQNVIDYARTLPPGTITIMHQGVTGADMGDYVSDPSAMNVEHLSHLRCYSGHYHRHQTIGTLTYCGSPYTMSFGEANDGPKGFLVLYDDGSFKREILDLRRHVIVERTTETVWDKLTESVGQQDLVWLKVTGPASELNALTKEKLAVGLVGHANFKFDRIYSDTPQVRPAAKARTPSQMVDDLIDGSGESEDQRAYLKTLYREIME